MGLDILNVNGTLLVVAAVLDLHCLLVRENLLTVRDMVGAAEESVNFLEGDLLSLRDEKPHEESKQEVDTREQVERIEAVVVDEDREELLEDCIGDILCL